MTKEHFLKVYKEWVSSNNPTLVNLSFLLYQDLMNNTHWATSDHQINEYYHKVDNDNYKINPINLPKTWEKLKTLPDAIYVYDIDDNKYLFFDDFFIGYDYGLEIFTRDGVIPQIFYDNIVFQENVPTIKICSGVTSAGVMLMDSEIKKVTKKDIEGHYNDDFNEVSEKIEEFIMDDNTSGLVILHGIPGTGKTYYIRSLITEHPKKDFVFIDINDFYTICNSKQYLGKLKDSILIIEDCEPLIKDREHSQFSQNISDLLNITDGLLGDTLNIKIICTFNVDVDKIDKALMRKGRIKIKYEFKELVEEKAKALCEKLGVEYTPEKRVLCDIFNSNTIGVENTKLKVKQNKIGF